jgi:hypothetical protein
MHYGHGDTHAPIMAWHGRSTMRAGMTRAGVERACAERAGVARASVARAYVGQHRAC